MPSSGFGTRFHPRWVIGVVAGGILALQLGTAWSAPAAPLWIQRFDAAGGSDIASLAAVSPDGATVFVAGTAEPDGPSTDTDFMVVAYDPMTGTLRWQSILGLSPQDDDITAMTVSPDGTRLYVTGWAGSRRPSHDRDAVTVSFDTSSGAALWRAWYNGPAGLGDRGETLAISPDGSTLYVAGWTQLRKSFGNVQDGWVVLAYQTSSGILMWNRMERRRGVSLDAEAPASTPDGSRVIVSATARFEDFTYQNWTIAYGAASGARLWASDLPAGAYSAAALLLSPDGSQTYLLANEPPGWALVSYATATGERRYVRIESGELYPRGLTVTPDGRTLVIGATGGSPLSIQVQTFDAMTGAHVLTSRYQDPSRPVSVRKPAMASDGAFAYFPGTDGEVSSPQSDFLLLAFDVATGAFVARTYDGMDGGDTGWAVAVTPDASIVVITGASEGVDTDTDAMTIADLAT